MCTHVSRAQLAAGDLVFFDGLGHEGMYIGGRQFIHAPHTGDVVKVSSMSDRLVLIDLRGRRASNRVSHRHEPSTAKGHAAHGHYPDIGVSC